MSKISLQPLYQILDNHLCDAMLQRMKELLIDDFIFFFYVRTNTAIIKIRVINNYNYY